MSSNKTFEKYTSWNTANRPYVLAAVAAIIVFMLVAPITEKGVSMDSTVGKGDVVILSKKTFSDKRGLPEYGDILVFKQDFYKTKNKGEHRLGRVVGVSGDTIEIKEGDVYRNGKKLKHESYEKGKTIGEVASQKIGANQVFVLCDNRANSVDSRNAEVGALSLKAVRGRALIVVWPFNNFGVLK